MSDLKQARALLEAAERDYSALRGMGDATVFADEIFGFHAEQAVEKLLKALLALLGQTYPATHDLARLVDMLKAHDWRRHVLTSWWNTPLMPFNFATVPAILARCRSTETRLSNAWKCCWKRFGGG